MLSTTQIDKVKNSVTEYWRDPKRIQEVADMSQGKESGHRIADYVDDKTTSFIRAHYEAVFEKDENGDITKRSMGDLWLKENDIYHPVNIKTGMSNSGSPNMVALGKLFKCLLLNQIDSYYLLMIKFVSGAAEPPKVYFVDMLDYLDCLSFDSGPGQIMLKSEHFFDGDEPVDAVPRSLLQKAEYLMQMLEVGDSQLVENREKRRKELQEMIGKYKARENFIVTPDSQKKFNFTP